MLQLRSHRLLHHRVGTRHRVVWLLVSDHPSVPAEAERLFGDVNGVSRDGQRYARRLLVSGSGEHEIGDGGTAASGLHTGPDLFTRAKTIAAQEGGPEGGVAREDGVSGAIPSEYPTYKLALREAWADWLLVSECDFVVAVAGERKQPTHARRASWLHSSAPLDPLSTD